MTSTSFVAALVLAALLPSVALAQEKERPLAGDVQHGQKLLEGANAGDVVRLVLRHAAVLVIIGTVLGLGGAWAAGRLVSSFLFGVNPHDPMALIAVSLTLGVTALVASAVPVRRATAADAMSALRAD